LKEYHLPISVLAYHHLWLSPLVAHTALHYTTFIRRRKKNKKFIWLKKWLP